jgi:hypothetical protein
MAGKLSHALMMSVIHMASGLAVANWPTSVLSQNATGATYQYDGLGRLKLVEYTLNPISGSSSIEIRLDKAGNRTPAIPIGSTTPPPGYQTAGANAVPVGRPDAFTAAPSIPVTLDVLANDTDSNGEKLTLEGFTIPVLQGTPTPSQANIEFMNNTIIYIPGTQTSNQTHTFTYSFKDGSGSLQYANVVVEIKELIPAKYYPRTNAGSFTGASGNGIGMRDALFGDLWPQYATTHATAADTDPQYFYIDFEGSYFVNKLVLSPIATSFPDPGVRGKEYLNGTAVIYNGNDGCLGSWTYADNLSAAIDNGYVVLNMADVVARCVAVTRIPGVTIGLSEIRLIGQPTGASGFRAPIGGDQKNPGSINLFYRRAIFEDELAKRRAKQRGEISAADASAPGNVPAPDFGSGWSQGIGGSIDTPTSRFTVASLPPGGSPSAVVQDLNAGELIPKSFTSSSALSDAFGGLVAEGMRDRDFTSIGSTFQTSISSNEYVIADLGDEKPVSRIDFAPIESLGSRSLVGAAVYTSSDCKNWTWLREITSDLQGDYISLRLDGSSVRCVKIAMQGSYLGLGDFRLF